MSTSDPTDFLDPGETNLDALSSKTVTEDRHYVHSATRSMDEIERDGQESVADRPCQFLFERIMDSESGCPSNVRQICRHPNQERSRKMWGTLVVLTDQLMGVIDEMQTWVENEAGIKGNRLVVRPVNPLEMAGHVDRVYEQVSKIRKLLNSSTVKSAKNFSDNYEFTKVGFVAKSDSENE